MGVAESDAAEKSGRISGLGAGSCLTRRCVALSAGVVVAFPLLAFSATNDLPGAEGSPPPPASSQLGTTNTQALLHTFLQLQEQVRATQLAIEQGRQATREASAQTAKALSNALQTIEESFSTQRVRDLEAMRSSNRAM